MMKQWIFKHIIMKLFDKEFSQWFHNEVYEPMMKPLPDNWMDDLSEEEWNEICKDINHRANKELMKTY